MLETGTSGKILIQTLPARRRCLVIALLAAARRAITRHLRRAGRVWIRIFPDVPVSSKPAEVRMGKGKGSPEYWICRVKPGRIMFELDGVSETAAKEALSLAAAKLPMHTKVVKRLGE